MPHVYTCIIVVVYSNMPFWICNGWYLLWVNGIHDRHCSGVACWNFILAVSGKFFLCAISKKDNILRNDLSFYFFHLGSQYRYSFEFVIKGSCKEYLAVSSWQVKVSMIYLIYSILSWAVCLTTNPKVKDRNDQLLYAMPITWMDADISLLPTVLKQWCTFYSLLHNNCASVSCIASF